MKYVINVHGFIGDILFASSIAEKLKADSETERVDYVIPLPQPLLLLQQNPYIDGVHVGMLSKDYLENHSHGSLKTIGIGQVDQSIPATIQMQKDAGIKEPTIGYKVYTVPEHDAWAQEEIAKVRVAYPDKKIVAWQADWRSKAYQTTSDQYWQIPKIGGEHRDIKLIINELSKNFIMIPVGLPEGIGQTDSRAANPESYSLTASLIKHCDWMIGSEGGLTNLAAGVGTPCIITTCFIHQLYGENGFLKQIARPQMGPAVYFPDAGHSHLYPWLNDAAVADTINRLIIHNQSYVFPGYMQT